MDADPTIDIRNTRKIARVIRSGIECDAAKVDVRIDQAGKNELPSCVDYAHTLRDVDGLSRRADGSDLVPFYGDRLHGFHHEGDRIEE
jgi:hypothetical protein